MSAICAGQGVKQQPQTKQSKYTGPDPETEHKWCNALQSCCNAIHPLLPRQGCRSVRG